MTDLTQLFLSSLETGEEDVQANAQPAAPEYQAFSEWSVDNATGDELQDYKSYANYARKTYLDAGAYNGRVEEDIAGGLRDIAVSKGLVNPEDEEAMRQLYAAPEASLESRLQSIIAATSSDTEEWETATAYLANEKALAKYDRLYPNTSENPELVERRAALRQAAEEIAYSDSYDKSIRQGVDTGNVLAARVKDSTGKSSIILSPQTKGMTTAQIIESTKHLGIGYEDAYEIATKNATLNERKGLRVADVERMDRINNVLDAVLTEDNTKGEILGTVEKSFGERTMAEEIIGEVTVSVDGTPHERAKKYFESAKKALVNYDKELAAGNTEKSAARMRVFESNVADLATIINKSGLWSSRGDDVSVEDMKLLIGERASQEATQQNAWEFQTDADKVKYNIKDYGIGLPTVHAAAIPRKDAFEAAIAANPQLTEAEVTMLRDNRIQQMTEQFDSYNEVLSNGSASDAWLGALQVGRSEGKKDVQILEDFLADEDNYSEFKDRATGIMRSIPNAIGTMAAAIPAMLGSEWATDYLVSVNKKTSDSRETARLFGADIGMGQDIAEMIAPVFADIAATTALSAVTGGVAGAGYLAAKQGSKITAKQILRGTLRNAYRAKGKETTEAFMNRLIKDGFIAKPVGAAGKAGAMEALESVNKIAAGRLPQSAAMVLPAMNRSSGMTYASVYQTLKDDNPEMSHEDLHDKALGAGITAGAITGFVTGVFGAVGLGGAEKAFMQGMTKKQFTKVIRRMSDRGTKLIKDDDMLMRGVLREATQKAIGNGGKFASSTTVIGDLLKDSTSEAAEEFIDEFLNGIVTDIETGRDTPMIERMQAAGWGAVAGGIFGAGFNLVGRGMQRGDRLAMARREEQAAEIKFAADVTSRLNEAGAPVTARVVYDMLTTQARRAGQATQAYERARARQAEAEAAPVAETQPSVLARADELETERASLDRISEEQGFFTEEQQQRSDAVDAELEQVRTVVSATAPAVDAEPSAPTAEAQPTPQVSRRFNQGLNFEPVNVVFASEQDANIYDQVSRARKVTRGQQAAAPDNELLQQLRDQGYDTRGFADAVKAAAREARSETEPTQINAPSIEDFKTLAPAETEQEVVAKETEYAAPMPVDSQEVTRVEEPVSVDEQLRITNEDVEQGDFFALWQDVVAEERLDAEIDEAPVAVNMPMTREQADQIDLFDYDPDTGSVSQATINSLAPMTDTERGNASDIGVDVEAVERGYRRESLVEQKAQAEPEVEFNQLELDAEAEALFGQGDPNNNWDTVQELIESGFPVRLQRNNNYGITAPPEAQAEFQSQTSNYIAEQQYERFPWVEVEVPQGAKEYKTEAKVTRWYDPRTGKLSQAKHRAYAVDGVGIFDNNPFNMQLLLDASVPIRIPQGFDMDTVNKKLFDIEPLADGGFAVTGINKPSDSRGIRIPATGNRAKASTPVSTIENTAHFEKITKTNALFNSDILGSQQIAVAQIPEGQTGSRDLAEGETISVAELQSRVENYAQGTAFARNFRAKNGQTFEADELVGYLALGQMSVVSENSYYANIQAAKQLLLQEGGEYSILPYVEIETKVDKSGNQLTTYRLKKDDVSTRAAVESQFLKLTKHSGAGHRKLQQVAKELSPMIPASIRKRGTPNHVDVIPNFVISSVLNNKITKDGMPQFGYISQRIATNMSGQLKTAKAKGKVSAQEALEYDAGKADDASAVDFDAESQEYSHVIDVTQSAPARSEAFADADEAAQTLTDAADIAGMDDPELKPFRKQLENVLLQTAMADTPTNRKRLKAMQGADILRLLGEYMAEGHSNKALNDFINNPDTKPLMAQLLSVDLVTPTAAVSSGDSEAMRLAREAGLIGGGSNMARSRSGVLKARQSRSRIAETDKAIANRANTAEAERLGLISGDPASVIAALEKIAADKSNESHALVAELLLENPDLIGRIDFTIGELNLKDTAGLYTKNTDGSHSVFINLNGHNGKGLTNVLLEEYLHATLSDALTAPDGVLAPEQRQARARLQNLMNEIKEAAIENQYDENAPIMDALANMDEFVAGILLSPDLQKEIKLLGVDAKPKKGFFRRIAEAIMKFFRKGVTAKESDQYVDAITDVITIVNPTMREASIKTRAKRIANAAISNIERGNAVARSLGFEPTADGIRGAAPAAVEGEVTLSAKEQEALADSARAEMDKVDQRAEQSANLSDEVFNSIDSDLDGDEMKQKLQNLLQYIRMITPPEVDVRFPESDVEMKNVAEMRDGRIFINRSRILELTEGLNAGNARDLVASVIEEEMAHVASYNALTQDEIDTIVDGMGNGMLKNIAASYLSGRPERLAEVNALLDAEPESEADADTRAALEKRILSTKRMLVEEHLRSMTQRVTRGFSTEEDHAFYKTNPSLLRVLFRYMSGVLKRLAATRAMRQGSGNPYIDSALNQMVDELRAIKRGYRAAPTHLNFDPNNPDNSFEVLSALVNDKMINDIDLFMEEMEMMDALAAAVTGQQMYDAARVAAGDLVFEPDDDAPDPRDPAVLGPQLRKGMKDYVDRVQDLRNDTIQKGLAETLSMLEGERIGSAGPASNLTMEQRLAVAQAAADNIGIVVNESLVPPIRTLSDRVASLPEGEATRAVDQLLNNFEVGFTAYGDAGLMFNLPEAATYGSIGDGDIELQGDAIALMTEDAMFTNSLSEDLYTGSREIVTALFSNIAQVGRDLRTAGREAKESSGRILVDLVSGMGENIVHGINFEALTKALHTTFGDSGFLHILHANPRNGKIDALIGEKGKRFNVVFKVQEDATFYVDSMFQLKNQLDDPSLTVDEADAIRILKNNGVNPDTGEVLTREELDALPIQSLIPNNESTSVPLLTALWLGNHNIRANRVKTLGGGQSVTVENKRFGKIFRDKAISNANIPEDQKQRLMQSADVADRDGDTGPALAPSIMVGFTTWPSVGFTNVDKNISSLTDNVSQRTKGIISTAFRTWLLNNAPQSVTLKLAYVDPTNIFGDSFSHVSGLLQDVYVEAVRKPDHGTLLNKENIQSHIDSYRYELPAGILDNLSEPDIKAIDNAFKEIVNASVNEAFDVVEAARVGENEWSVLDLIEKKGKGIWKKYGWQQQFELDLTPNSKSGKTFARVMTRMAKHEAKKEGVTLEGLNTLASSITPDGGFSDRVVNFESFTKSVELPVYKSGEYDTARSQGIRGFFQRIFQGELDPRIIQLNDDRLDMMRGSSKLVEQYKKQMDSLIRKTGKGDDIDFRKDLEVAIGDANGFAILTQQRYDAIEDAHTEELKAIMRDESLTEAEKKSKIAEADTRREAAIESAEVDVRQETIRNKEAALSRVEEVSPELATHIRNVREKLIKPLTKELRDMYGEDDKTIQARLDDNMDIYITRSYRMFTDVTYADKVRNDPAYAEVRENALRYFRDNYIQSRTEELMQDEDMSQSDAKFQATQEHDRGAADGRSMAQRMLNRFLDRYAMPQQSDIARDTESSYRVLLDNLKQKKDIPKPLRDLLGEYGQDGTVDNLLRTFSTVSKMVAQQRFLNQIKKMGQAEGFLVTQEEVDADPETYKNWAPVRPQKTLSSKDPLKGLYGPPEFVDGLLKTFDRTSVSGMMSTDEKAASWIGAAARKATGWSMASKTLGSIGFYVRNLASNMFFFGPSQGYVGAIYDVPLILAKRSGVGIKKALTDQHLDEAIVEYTRLGVIGDDVRSNTMMELMRGQLTPDVLLEEETKRLEKLKKFGKPADWVYKKAAQAASAVDAIYKIGYFEHELKTLRKAAKIQGSEEYNMSDQQLKMLAAKKVKMTAQSHSQTLPIVKQWTGGPATLLFAPFVRFKAEVPRILFNTYKLGIEEVRSSNPVIRNRGIKRLGGMTTMLSGVSAALPMIMAKVAGIGDDEDEALRKSMPEYLRDQTFYYLKDDEGNYKSINFTFINPYSGGIVDPVLRMVESLRRGDGKKAITDLVNGVFFAPYLDEQILAGTVVDLMRNTDANSDNPIYEDTIHDTGEKIMLSIQYLLKEAYGPDVWKRGDKIIDAAGIDQSLLRKDDMPLNLLLESTYPFKIHDVDLDQQYTRKLRELRDEYNRLGSLKYKAYSRKPQSDEAIAQLYHDTVAGRLALENEIASITRGFIGLGMNPVNAMKQMTTAGGISKQRARGIFIGRMDKPLYNPDYFRGLLEKAQEGATNQIEMDVALRRAGVLYKAMASYGRYIDLEEKIY